MSKISLKLEIDDVEQFLVDLDNILLPYNIEKEAEDAIAKLVMGKVSAKPEYSKADLEKEAVKKLDESHLEWIRDNHELYTSWSALGLAFLKEHSDFTTPKLRVYNFGRELCAYAGIYAIKSI